jgi:hypothetical protein
MTTWSAPRTNSRRPTTPGRNRASSRPSASSVSKTVKAFPLRARRTFSAWAPYAQRRQQNIAKVKADARNLVGIIGGDKTKTRTYCQIDDLSEQLAQAVQENDDKEAKALAEKITQLNKKMGPEFAALVNIEKRVDLNSPDGQEIASIVASLGESCGEK